MKHTLLLAPTLVNREANIKKALEFLKEKIKIIKTSSLYETKPMYIEDQGWFLNGAAKVETELTPRELLDFSEEASSKN